MPAWLRSVVWVPVLALVGVHGIGVAQGPQPGWPQWGGPERNFHVEAAGLSISWPAGGPAQIWRRSLGEGYSAIVVDEGTLFTMYRSGGEELIVALAADTGETRWQHAYDAPIMQDGFSEIWLNSAGPGPYSTPLVVGSMVFAVDVHGQFHALDKQTGTVLWSRNLVDEFNLSDYHGFASSPIAYANTVILPVGGNGHGVVAFNQETGAVVWQNQDLDLAPASPILIDVDGEEQLVILAQRQLVGVDPKNGDFLWSHPHGDVLNLSTPVWGNGNLLFASTAYDGDSRVIRLRQVDGETTTEELWFNNRMRVHFGNALRIGDLVIGTTGDFGPAFFAALDIRTGEELWRERSFGRSHMLYADGKLVIVDEDGDIAVATVTARGLEVYARAHVLTENAWTPPTLVGTTLYVRDRRSILALDLGV